LARVGLAGSFGFFGGDLAIRPRIWGESCGEERSPASVTRLLRLLGSEMLGRKAEQMNEALYATVLQLVAP
jgi:hypothetical protein